jgi:ethanolamine permease
MGDDELTREGPGLDDVVREVVGAAELRPEDEAYLKAHALKKPLRVPDIWALGVGVVITGAYFGWNLGLEGNGPVAMLIASLLVCLLYLMWVLALAELSVAMPFAGGPLAYGRRVGGPWLGFVMGWSMFLECLFATIATALATGGCVAYLIHPDNPSPQVKTAVALATVVLFFLLQAWGVKEQSRAMMVMTYGAILGLAVFWVAAATNFSVERVWPARLLGGKGWRAVLDAVPYALWWLVMIETVALAAEEAHEPHRTIPRGLVWAQLTLIALVVLTWLFACAAADYQELAVTHSLGSDGTPKEQSVDYPLLKAVSLLPGRSSLLFFGFGAIAMFGLIASYHGMVYGTSRQAFALGRAGYLPLLLGEVHAVRRTPVPALLLCSLVAAAFAVANLWFDEAISVAVLVSTLAALVWYILAMACLFVLRRREPHLFARYRTPVGRLLPAAVVVLSVFAACVYGGIKVEVILPTLGLYGVGLAYFGVWGRRRIQKAAPEELATREAQPLTEAHHSPPRGLVASLLEAATAAVLLAVLAALAWVVLAAYWPAAAGLASMEVGVGTVLALLTAALVLVSVVALLHTRFQAALPQPANRNKSSNRSQ